jgi:hypothetical protein
MTNNILFGNIKVGDIIEYCLRQIKVAKIQNGYPTGLIIGYDKYNNRVKVPFNNK